jgi:F0F1-type ATP synthase delta subunit
VRDETVARNYAETLFELSQRYEGLEEFGAGIDLVAGLIDEDPRFRLFLETPRISDVDRKATVEKVFGRAIPRPGGRARGAGARRGDPGASR